MTYRKGWIPGPWTACKNGECSCKTVSDEHGPIAVVEAGEWGDTFPDLRLVDEPGAIGNKVEAFTNKIAYGSIAEKAAVANAQLIAAAPRLFEALEKAVATMDGQKVAMGWIDEARAALLAADGQGDEQ